MSSISVKDAKLYELCRGLKLSGTDTSEIFEAMILAAQAKAKEVAGNDLDIALQADETDIDKKLAELQARKSVIKSMRKSA